MIFQTFGKTVATIKEHRWKPANFPPLGVKGDKFRKGLALLPSLRLAGKPCAVNNYI